MKNIFILLLCLTMPFYGYCQDEPAGDAEKTEQTTDSNQGSNVADTVAAAPKEAKAPHPLPHVSSPGGVTTMCVLFGLAFGIIIIIVIRSAKFNLRDALSENADDKVLVENPHYKELPALVKALMQSQTAQAGSNDAQAKAQQATADRETAEAALTAAQDAVTQAGDAATDDQKNAVTTAQTALDTALQAEQQAKSAAGGGSTATSTALSPAMLVNLSNLFPPTMEVTKVPANGESKYRPSISRLIAFFCGIVLIIVGLSMTCFYIYYYLCTGDSPDLASLSAVLIALGFGMAPYAVNKISNTATK